jgi:16S rRNA (guanine527-N7)-methyltransferase
VTSQWLYRALEESRARGYLGPVAIETQVAHASGFASVWGDLFPDPPSRFLDLGSGGGLPGLVLFENWGRPATFVDSMLKRTSFLAEVLQWEGAPADGRVINGRAELLARTSDLEGMFPLVTARSFGPPAVTAECAVRFLSLEGILIISEPPNDDEIGRWNLSALGQLGLRSEGRVRHGAAYHVLRKVRATPDRYPRGSGTPGKSPLF